MIAYPSGWSWLCFTYNVRNNLKQSLTLLKASTFILQRGNGREEKGEFIVYVYRRGGGTCP
jgi:hypothetical protein